MSYKSIGILANLPMLIGGKENGANYIFDIQPRKIEFTWGNIESTYFRYKPGN